MIQLSNVRTDVRFTSLSVVVPMGLCTFLFIAFLTAPSPLFAQTPNSGNENERTGTGVDTTWTDLDRLAARLGSIRQTNALQDRLVRYGLLSSKAIPYKDPIRRQQNWPLTSDSTHFDVFYQNLFGDQEKEGILQVRAYGFRSYVSIFEKTDGRWTRVQRVNLTRFHGLGAEGMLDGCEGTVCFDFLEAIQEDESVIVVQDASNASYRGNANYWARIRAYRILRDRTDLILNEVIGRSAAMKSKPWTLTERHADYRWVRSAGKRFPRYVVLEETLFGYGNEEVGTRWKIAELSDPDSSTNGYAPVPTPSPEELGTAGLTIHTPDRPTRIDGSLRAFRDRLREVEHADSLAARLQRRGLVPAHGLRPDGPPPSPDSVSIDVFPANLYGDPLREAVVQVRAGGRTYSLSFFEAVPGGWERHPGLVHVNAPASVDGCPGGFCFDLAEARAEGEMLVSSWVGREGDGKTWAPIQVTAKRPAVLALSREPSGTTVGWGVGQKDERSRYGREVKRYPRYGVLKRPVEAGGTVEVRTSLPDDVTGEDYRLHIAALEYAGGTEDLSKTELPRDSVRTRADRRGGSDRMAMPALKPYHRYPPTVEGKQRPAYDEEVYGGKWMFETQSGTVGKNPQFENMETYFHDIRWAIEREKWSRLVGIIAPSYQEGRSSGIRPSQVGTEYLHLDKDAAKRLSRVGVDSVSYKGWSLYPVEGEDEDSALNVSGDLVLEDGSVYQMDLFFDIRENRVYLTKMPESDRVRFAEEFENSVSGKRWEKLVRDMTHPEQVELKYSKDRKHQFIYELISTCMVGNDCVRDVNQVEKEGIKCQSMHEEKGYERYLKSISDFRVTKIENDKIYFKYKFYDGACRYAGHIHLKKQPAVEEGELYLIGPRG